MLQVPKTMHAEDSGAGCNRAVWNSTYFQEYISRAMKELKPGKNACCKLDYLPNGHFLPPLPFLLAPTGCLACIS